MDPDIKEYEHLGKNRELEERIINAVERDYPGQRGRER